MRLVGLSALAIAVLTACGDDDGSGAAAEPSASTSTHATDLPFCTEVWVADARLPSRYQGCEEDGQAVSPHRRFCASGQTILTYGDRFYVVLGHPIQETDSLSSDRDYQRTISVCQG